MNFCTRTGKHGASIIQKFLLQLPCISSTRNSQVKIARNASKHGLMKLEGKRLIADAINYGGIIPKLIFISEDSVVSNDSFHEALAPIFAASNSTLSATRILRAAPHVIAAVSDTSSPPGIVALAQLPEAGTIPLITSQTPSMSVVCDGVSDPGNLGTLIRSAAAAQADAVYCVTPCCDPWSPKVLRAGMGAHFRIPLFSGRQADIIRAFNGVDQNSNVAGPDGRRVDTQQQRIYVAGVDDASTQHLTYTEVDWTEPFVLVLGSEADGPKHSWDIDTCPSNAPRHVVIPMARGVESLNVGVAASVILFEAKRQRSLN